MTDRQASGKRKELQQELLRHVLNMRDIPTLPTVMHNILQTVSDENSTHEQLTRILENDPAISTSVLRLSNSAFYGLSKTVDSIQRAVVLIGFDAVEMLALATSVLSSFSGKDAKGFNADDFWMHALGCAKASQLVAKRSGQDDIAEIVFTTGLLHEIGKFFSALALPEKYVKILDAAEEEGKPVHKIERRLMDIDHSYVAAWVCEKWLFPPEIVEPIRCQFYDEDRIPEDWKIHIQVLHTGDAIAKAAGYGYTAANQTALNANDVPEGLDLELEDLLKLVEEMKAKKDETRQILNILG
jgi:HD-like signal output (HDOD) protein